MTEKKVLITGGAQGIGYAVSKELLARGSQVCVLDINANVGKQMQETFRTEFGQDKIKFISCDVTNEDLFSEAVKESKEFLGHFNVFINNVGVVDEYHIASCVNINLISVIYGTNLAIQHMNKENGGNGGQIINVASVAACLPVPFFPIYCATKSGVMHFTRSWAKHPDIDSMGITFQSICPVFTDTPLIHNFKGKVLKYEGLRNHMDKVGYISVDRVVDAFMKILTENKNGGVLEVTYDGTKYLFEEN